MKLIRLTAPNGKAVWVVPTWVQSVRTALAGEYPSDKARSVIVMSGNNQAVTEYPADVVKALEST